MCCPTTEVQECFFLTSNLFSVGLCIYAQQLFNWNNDIANPVIQDDLIYQYYIANFIPE